jgi:acetyl-CoA C-acetyltransferase
MTQNTPLSDSVVIVAARRTAIGNLNGSLATVTAPELGRSVIESALSDSAVAGHEVDDVILGQVLTAGAGQNPARQAAMKAGIPKEKTALTINQVCGSGLRAVAMGTQSLLLGDADIVVAGGQESMSQSPHLVAMRAGVKFGHSQLTDSMIHDGLWDIFNDYHMGVTAENIAQQFQITRDAQDALAAR